MLHLRDLPFSSHIPSANMPHACMRRVMHKFPRGSWQQRWKIKSNSSRVEVNAHGRGAAPIAALMSYQSILFYFPNSTGGGGQAPGKRESPASYPCLLRGAAATVVRVIIYPRIPVYAGFILHIPVLFLRQRLQLRSSRFRYTQTLLQRCHETFSLFSSAEKLLIHDALMLEKNVVWGFKSCRISTDKVQS